jgi:hypothetical protein
MTHGRSWRASAAEEDRTGPGTEVAIVLACADDRSVTEVSAELGHFPDDGGKWRGDDVCGDAPAFVDL